MLSRSLTFAFWVVLSAPLLVTVSGCADPAGDPVAFRLAGNLEPGHAKVGFRTEFIPLPSAAEGQPTGIQLYLWYPAEPDGSGEAMAYADYYRAQEADPPDHDTLQEWLREDMTSPPDLTTDALDRLLAGPMWATRDAPMTAGDHPLVLWSYRDSIPTMQAVLNEFLASHGYIVVFGWPTDHVPPLPWHRNVTAADKLASLETQVGLLEAVLDTMKGREGVAADHTAVLSWSYGGESANRLQRRRPEVRLALGMDSTLASGWIFQDALALEQLDRGELTVPYVLLRHGRPRIDGEPTPEAPLLAEVPAGAWSVRLRELSHGNFNVPGGLFPGILGLSEVSDWAVGGDAARLGYEQVCRHLLGFTNRYLRDDLSAPENWGRGAPEGFVRVIEHRPRLRETHAP